MARSRPTAPALPRPDDGDQTTNEVWLTKSGIMTGPYFPAAPQPTQQLTPKPGNPRPTKRELAGTVSIVVFICLLIAIALCAPIQPS